MRAELISLGRSQGARIKIQRLLVLARVIGGDRLADQSCGQDAVEINRLDWFADFGSLTGIDITVRRGLPHPRRTVPKISSGRYVNTLHLRPRGTLAHDRSTFEIGQRQTYPIRLACSGCLALLVDSGESSNKHDGRLRDIAGRKRLDGKPWILRADQLDDSCFHRPRRLRLDT